MANQFSAPVQNLSLHRKFPSDFGGETSSRRLLETAAINGNIMRNGLVVNPELTHISKLYETAHSYYAAPPDTTIIIRTKPPLSPPNFGKI